MNHPDLQLELSTYVDNTRCLQDLRQQLEQLQAAAAEREAVVDGLTARLADSQQQIEVRKQIS
jgi:uncharacterized protein YlxW (UPF0749 family)